MNNQSASHRPNWEKGGNILLLLAGFFFVAGALITVADVAMRAFSSASVPAVIEITTLLIGIGAVLSMPVCFLKDRHVTAKLLSEFIPAMGRKLSFLAATLSILFAALLTFMMGKNALSKWSGFESMPDTGLPVAWLLALIAVIFAISVVAALQALINLARGKSHYG